MQYSSVLTVRSRGHSLAFGAMFASGACVFGGAASAATITVNSLSDTSTSGDGQCALREALANANSNSDTTGGDCVAGSGADTINLTALAGTITLGGTQLTISDSTTVTGPGAGTLTIDGANTSRVFYIYNSAAALTVNISGVTASHGRAANGGAIVSKGEIVALNNVTLSASTGTNAGGGVANIGGSLTVNNSTISGNTASSTSGGGGVYSVGGALTISGSTITGNTASSLVGRGGAISILSTTQPTSISNSTITSNTTSGKGGAIAVKTTAGGGTVTIDNTMVNNNTATGRGGAMFLYRNGGAITITRSAISGNTTNNRGAGLFLYNVNANVTVQDTTVSGNTAPTAAGNGAGIFLYKVSAGATFTLDRSTVSGNSANRAGGGFFLYKGSGATVIQNSTFSGNSSGTTGGAFFDRGPFGGTATLTIQNSTIAGNSAGTSGGNVSVTSVPTTIRNSVISGGTAPSSPDLATGGSNVTANYSLIQDNTGATYSGVGDIIGVAANLSSLGSFGGYTQTRLPLSNSPLVNAGDPTFVPPPATDQRGQPRIKDGRLDIGAVESGVLQPAATLSGTVGVFFAAALSAIGGSTPYTYSISGAVPPGLTFSTSTGLLFGTPTGGGSFTFQVTVIDGAGDTASQTYSLPIAAPTIAITPSSLPAGQVGSPYFQAVSASGGTGAKTFSATGLPPGLSISAVGVISGTPTQGGAFTAMITATDASANAGPYNTTASLGLTVSTPTIAVTPASLAATSRGATVSTQLSATGGIPAYSYAVTGGALPAGVTLSPTGLISGTLAASGSFSFDVTATDSSTPTHYSGVKSYTWAVSAPTITLSSTLPNGTVGGSYSSSVTASGGTATYSYAVTSGTLPTGLTLSPSGALTGTLTGGGAFTFAITATDSSAGGGPYAGTQSYTVNVAAPTITLSSALPGGTVGSGYSSVITASGGTSGYTYAVTGGALPTGLTLSPSGALTGTLTGGGTFNFGVTATDSSANAGPYTGTRSYSVTIAAPTITLSGALPGGAVGSGYSSVITAAGGTAGYTYAVTSGALPSGLTLSPSGVLTGVLTGGGTFNFTVTATDSSANAGPYTGSQAYSVTIAAPTIALSGGLPGGAVGTPYSGAVTATGGTAGYTYAVTSGALPAGVSLSSGGVLSGTPTSGGTFAFDITATDSSANAGPYSGTRSYSVSIAQPSVTVSPSSLPVTMRGDNVYIQFAASGGNGSYTYAVTSGALPAGVTLSASGLLSGTLAGSGTFTFDVTATDSTPGTPFSGAQGYTWVIGVPNLHLFNLPGGTVGIPYTGTAGASGGAAPYTFAVTAGALPTGLMLAPDGTFSGLPSAPGTYNFTLAATDASGAGGPYGGSRSYTVVIAVQTLTLPTTTLSNGTVGQAYSGVLNNAQGGAGPYSYAVTAGALPAGVSLGTNGLLSGTPTEDGTFNFTVTVTDGSPNPGPYTATQAYTLTVDPAPPPVPAVPTLTEWAAWLFSGLLAAAAMLGRSRRRRE